MTHDTTQLVIDNSNFQLKQNLLSVVFSLYKPNKIIKFLKVPELFSLWFLPTYYPSHNKEYTQTYPTYLWGLERVRIVSTAPFLRFGCTTAALATNPPIECPTRITLVGRILPLSSFCCDLIPTEFLYRSRICHNESLSILNKTIILLLSCIGCWKQAWQKTAEKLYTVSAPWNSWEKYKGTHRYAESTWWTACTTYSACSSRIRLSMADCSPSKSMANQSRWLAYCPSTVTFSRTSVMASPSEPASRGVKEDCW